MSSSKQSVGIVAGVIAGAAIAFVAGQWMTEAEAQVPGLGGQGHGMAIPAIEISEGSIALVCGPNGQYFVIDRQGNAYPVRYRNEDLTPPVGATLLRAP